MLCTCTPLCFCISWNCCTADKGIKASAEEYKYSCGHSGAVLLHACQICNTGSVLLMFCGSSFKIGHLRRGRCRCCRYSTWSWLHARCYDNAGQTSEHFWLNLRHGSGYTMQLALCYTIKRPTVPAAARVTTKPFCFHGHARKLRKFKRTADHSQCSYQLQQACAKQGRCNVAVHCCCKITPDLACLQWEETSRQA